MAEVTFERVGDVTACHFDGEEDVALFVQGSGDVLLSSLAQWRSLKCGETAPSTSIASGAAQSSSEFPPDGLRSILLSLGAAIE